MLIDWESAAPDVSFEIRVRDVQQANAFYRGVLGARETFRRATEDCALVRAGLAAGDVQFVISSEDMAGPETALLSHLATELGVPFLAVIVKVDDPGAAVLTAVENGAVLTETPDDVVVITDPFSSHWAFVRRQAADQAKLRSSLLH